MFYQLPNGKVIEMSTEQFVELSDEEIEYLLAYNYGESLENPWFGSAISHKNADHSLFEPEQLPELSDLSREEKIDDLDVDFTDE
jgi:hypothetical protein